MDMFIRKSNDSRLRRAWLCDHILVRRRRKHNLILMLRQRCEGSSQAQEPASTPCRSSPAPTVCGRLGGVLHGYLSDCATYEKLSREHPWVTVDEVLAIHL